MLHNYRNLDIKVSSQGSMALYTSKGFCQESKHNMTRRRLPVFESITSANRQRSTMHQTNLANDGRRETGIVEIVGPYHGFIKCDDQEEYLYFRIGQFLGDKGGLKANGKTNRKFDDKSI